MNSHASIPSANCFPAQELRLSTVDAAARGGARGEAEGLCGEALLRTRALTLALRYRSIGGAGFQAGLGRPVFDALREAAGVSTEAFA